MSLIDEMKLKISQYKKKEKEELKLFVSYYIYSSVVLVKIPISR